MGVMVNDILSVAIVFQNNTVSACEGFKFQDYVLMVTILNQSNLFAWLSNTGGYQITFLEKFIFGDFLKRIFF